MRPLLFVLAALVSAAAHAQAPVPSRGQLLYEAHCVECHTTQMHWREQRLAHDFSSLKFQVRRFQGIAGLSWSDEDIEAVANYLNDTIYRYPANQASR